MANLYKFTDTLARVYGSHKTLIKVILLIAAAILVSALFVLAKNSQLNDSQSQPTEAESNFKNLNNSSMGISLTYPSYLTLDEDSENTFSLVDKNDSSSPFRLYIRFSKSLNSDKNFFSAIYKLAPNDPYLENSQDPSREATIVKITNLEVDGQKGVKVEENSQIPGPFFAQRIYVPVDKSQWTISIVAPTQNDTRKKADVFNQIVDSIKFTN